MSRADGGIEPMYSEHKVEFLVECAAHDERGRHRTHVGA